MKKNEGLWVERFDDQGNSSLRTHVPKVVWTSCKECYYEITGNRELTCRNCGKIANIVLGMQTLKDGKIIQCKVPPSSVQE